MKKFLCAVVMALSFVSVAQAQAYDIKVMTPDVKAAIDGRRERFADLKALKAQGLVGENNNGYVEDFDGGLDVKDFVNDENRDRKVVYKAIVEQNQLGAGALTTVEDVFAAVQRDKAAAGEKIQDPAGNWLTK